ncbi:hypothetical protein FBU30_001383 [Linnemannia zychae]|nr:hypothetical protein FBU30_001383 [Linnemannia zychae]
MELMKENQPPVDIDNAGWKNNDLAGLDLLVKAAQKSSQPKKPKTPKMVLTGSYTTPVIVGRGSQATLNLGRINKQVSRRHAIIQWCAETLSFEITVLGQNGVRINGTGFPSGQQATLHSGDIVDLVGVKLLFRTPTTPPPSALSTEEQEYQDDDLSTSQSSILERFHEEEQIFGDSADIGLVTPKRSKHSTNYQLATPGTSSPSARDSSTSPTQLTPTARMRHKMMKYDFSSSPNRNNVYRTPPSASSDSRTDYGTSPVKSPPVFSIPFDALPKRVHNPTSSSSESNIFMDDSASSSPFRVPSQEKRTPLTPLALNDNNPLQVSRPSSQKSPQKSSSTVVPQLSKSSKDSANTKSTSAKSGAVPQKSVTTAKDIENITPITEETTQKVSKSKSKENSNIKSENKVKASISPTITTQAQSKVKDTATKSTTSTSTTVKTLKTKSVPRDKAISTASKDSADIVKQNKTESTDAVTSASATKSISLPPPSSSSSSSPSDKEPRDYTEMIIDTLVFARKKKSMTLTELFDEMITSQPSLMVTHNAEEIKEQMLECLSAARCVGKIARKGKDAYNKPLESQWYYIPEADHNVMRKLTRQEVMPSARKCTLKDKQYFFKMPPKLPYHRKSTSPYAVKASTRRAKESSKLSTNDDGSNGDVSSSSSDQEEEDADDQPLSTTLNRKRKSAVTGHADKKRKSSVPTTSTTTATTGLKHSDEEEEEEEEIDEHNDSLDDLSELSGLSD